MWKVGKEGEIATIFYQLHSRRVPAAGGQVHPLPVHIDATPIQRGSSEQCPKGNKNTEHLVGGCNVLWGGERVACKASCNFLTLCVTCPVKNCINTPVHTRDTFDK